MIFPCRSGKPLPVDIPPDLPFGRHCGRGNIIRHYAPDPQDVDLGDQEAAAQIMVTVWRGDLLGQLWRWVAKDGEVTYEVRIDGAEDSGGICDIAAFSIAACAAVANVANELQYEWEDITGVFGREWHP